MKKNIIALLLSVALVAGNVGTIPALATETDVQDEVPAETAEEVTKESEGAEDVAAETAETAAEADTVQAAVEEPEQSAVEEAEEAEAEEAEAAEAENTDAEEADSGLTEETAAAVETEQEAVESVAEESEEVSAGGGTTEETADVEKQETESVDEPDQSEGPDAEVAEKELTVEGETVVEAGKEATHASIASGNCGINGASNAKWTLTGSDNSLTLTISGTGDTDGYSEDILPWKNYKDKIKSVVVESGIVSLGEFIFCELSNLTSVSLCEGISLIENGSFANCSSLSSLEIPSSVETIGTYAFEGCSSLSAVTIPSGMTEIREGTFSGCSSLSAVTIPASVTKFGESSFEDCGNIDKIYISNLKSWLNIEDDYSGIAGNLYLNNNILTSVTIPNGYKEVRTRAFAGCEKLKSVTIPESVTVIRAYAFEDCKSLESVEIPSKVTELEDAAFNRCSSLNKLTIPAGLERIGESAFADCGNVDQIHISDLKAWLNINEFYSYLSGNLYLNGKKLTSVKIPSGITDIRESAFAGCSGLKSVTIHTKVTGIGDTAFAGCTSLKTLTVPISVTYIGEDAFASNINIRYPGTKNDWKDAVGESSITYASISYNCFSVEAAFKLSGTSFSYTGKAIKPTVKVTYDGSKLTSGKDYKLTYKNNINAGTATVQIKGIGEYSGTETMTFTIKKVNNKITANNFTKIYSSKAQSFNLGAKAKGGTLSYKSNNKKVTVSKNGKVNIAAKFIGSAVITITASATKNINKATKKIKIVVKPSGTTLSSVKNAASKKMVVKWKRHAAVTGYQIQYSVSGNFKNSKTISIAKNSTTSKTITNLKKGKNYYVRIRTYKKSGNTTLYSEWSKKKSVKIKK